MSNPNLIRATALLTGTVIGAGVLGIPYAISQAGFLSGLITIILLGLAMLMLNLFFGEIILRTPGNHQLPGYAERYCGKWGKRIAVFSLFFGIYGALVAYTIGEGVALSAIFGLNPTIFSLLFLLLMSIMLYKGIKTISKYEFYFLGAVLALVLIIAFIAISSSKFNYSYLAEFNLYNLLIPFGVILFAFRGLEAIPEMKEVLVRDRKKLKKGILIGSLIPLVAYALFAFATLGITGKGTTEIVTIGLGDSLGPGMIILGNIFAIFAMLTSFLTLGLAMKEIYMFDYKLKPKLAWALTIFVPLVLFLVGHTSFIQVIGITGAIVGSVQGVLIVMMYWKARKKSGRIPEYQLGKKTITGIILIIIFLIGLLYQILNLT